MAENLIISEAQSTENIFVSLFGAPECGTVISGEKPRYDQSMQDAITVVGSFSAAAEYIWLVSAEILGNLVITVKSVWTRLAGTAHRVVHKCLVNMTRAMAPVAFRRMVQMRC